MRNALPWLAAGALALVALQQGCENRELRADSERADSLRTVFLEERAAAQGWRTLLVTTTENLVAVVQTERDRNALHVDEKAALAREIESLGGRLAIMTDLYADARGQIIAHAEVHGSDEVAPDSITAPVDDGLLSGQVSYYPPRQAFGLDYRVSLGITLAATETPDGQTLVTAMAEHERVNLRFGEIRVAAPRVVEHCSLGQRAKAAGYGALGSELLQALFGALRK